MMRTCLLIASFLLLWLSLRDSHVAGAPRGTLDQPEAPGPFASWADAKRDFGAVGDGRTDDTGALQKALAALRPPNGKAVLYLPAGTYRITRTLRLIRESNNEPQDIGILGEDPRRTILRWDG